jgi:hypothetical protein
VQLVIGEQRPLQRASAMSPNAYDDIRRKDISFILRDRG